ncbi:MAG: type II toxin-antitoxin system RelE/ParE family toxin [Phycisphaeraceae bacterium]
MKFTVIIEELAEADADEIHDYLSRYSVLNADRWFRGLLDACTSLEEMPNRFKLAPESDRFDFDVRQMNFGVYRVYYRVDGDKVRIMHIRHGARRYWEP